MISSIILAAGMSTRMGQPKALLDWGGEPLIAYQIRQLKEAGVDEIIVVLGFHGDDIHRQIRRLPCRVMLNPRYFAGRAGSLRIGAKAVNRDAEAIVIVNVDQPAPAASIHRLIEAHNDRYIATRPTVGGRHGHPVIVSGRLRPELLEATEEDEGLRGILRRHAAEIQDVPGDDLNVADLDTPDDYQDALKAFGVSA
jgi:CTP:molybdopterin cytidylyltransferase MocA